MGGKTFARGLMAFSNIFVANPPPMKNSTTSQRFSGRHIPSEGRRPSGSPAWNIADTSELNRAQVKRVLSN
jgi:hypothetical protein